MLIALQAIPVPPIPPLPQIPWDPNVWHGPPVAVMVVSIVFGTLTTAIIGYAFFRALGKRWERKAVEAKPSPEMMARLERIEQAVDAISIEVERISEGQRFTTKLLAEMRAIPLPAGAPGASGQRTP